MIRFVPDHWFDGLMRPFLLLDPVAWLHTEIIAPDSRFAALILLIAFCFLSKKRRALFLRSQIHIILLFGFLGSFYFWVFISGNSRYFFWGMTVVGPILVVTLTLLVSTWAIRNTIILGTIGIQYWLVFLTFQPNVWGMRPWNNLHSQNIENLSYFHNPSIIFTIGAPSFSFLAKYINLDSHWFNAGVYKLSDNQIEFNKVRNLLKSNLPKYAIYPIEPYPIFRIIGPPTAVIEKIEENISYLNLRVIKDQCLFIQGEIPVALNRLIKENSADSFIICLLEEGINSTSDRSKILFSENHDDVFWAIENKCSKFFPKNSSQTHINIVNQSRYYAHSDTKISIYRDGSVQYQHFRSVNPKFIGTVEEIRNNQVKFECRKLEGRYVPPWSRAKKHQTSLPTDPN